MENSEIEDRKTVTLAGAVNVSYKSLSIFRMCLFCMLLYSPDIETRLYSINIHPLTFESRVNRFFILYNYLKLSQLNHID